MVVLSLFSIDYTKMCLSRLLSAHVYSFFFSKNRSIWTFPIQYLHLWSFRRQRVKILIVQSSFASSLNDFFRNILSSILFYLIIFPTGSNWFYLWPGRHVVNTWLYVSHVWLGLVTTNRSVTIENVWSADSCYIKVTEKSHMT